MPCNVLGSGPAETHTLPWRLESDMTLVAFEKAPMPFCQFLCKIGQERGITDLAIWDHECMQKMEPAPWLNLRPKPTYFAQTFDSQTRSQAPAGTDKSGPTLVPWRYDVKPDPSMSTNCFKPNSLASGFDHSAHKPSTLGCAFGGAMDKVPRQSSCSHAGLVWEAGVCKKKLQRTCSYQ